MILGNIDKNNSTAEPIVPIDFTPHNEKGPGITLKFRPIHVVLLIVSLVLDFQAGLSSQRIGFCRGDTDHSRG